MVGKACDDGFVYASNTNDEWLSIDELRPCWPVAPATVVTEIEIPYGRQSIDDADIAAVVEVLRSDWFTQGPAVERFEDALCSGTGAAFAVAFATGTVRAACRVAGRRNREGRHRGHVALVVRGQRQLRAVGGREPTFVDIDPKTLNIELGNIGRCDALVAVHYAGLPIDLAALVARPHVVVEDAAHALGAR